MEGDEEEEEDDEEDEEEEGEEQLPADVEVPPLTPSHSSDPDSNRIPRLIVPPAFAVQSVFKSVVNFFVELSHQRCPFRSPRSCSSMSSHQYCCSRGFQIGAGFIAVFLSHWSPARL